MRPALALALTCSLAIAGEPAADPARTVAEASRWLLARQQADGAFCAPPFALGITELALGALLAPPAALAVDDARVQRAVAYIRTHRQDDGGIYQRREGLGVYGTGLGILALRAAGALDDDTAARARRFLLGLQNLDPGSSGYGGIGYDDGDPAGSEDLHNSSTAVEALRAAGVPASDPRLQAVLHFTMLCQDLSHPGAGTAPPRLDGLPQPPAQVHQRRTWVTGGGGGTLRPTVVREVGAAGGHEDESGRKPSAYGTMTYTMLATYLALDLAPSDPRVVAGVDWVRHHWDLERNPGMPAGQEQAGLYYGYAVLSRALSLAGAERLELADGRSVVWREELARAIAARARSAPEGLYWYNDHPRWGEGLPPLATAYALAALKRCLPP